jgi:hypothetical protein
MTIPTIEALQQENAELRQKLRNLHNRVWGPRTGPDPTRGEVGSRLASSLSITEIGPHLREVALRCVDVAREGAGTRAAQELEDISIALTDRASSLEAALAPSAPDNDAAQ